jgi:putative membrane protein insertion efficiency factor
MKHLILVIFILLESSLFAQNKETALIRDHSSSSTEFGRRHPSFISRGKFNPVRYTLGGLMFVYQKTLSPLTNAECPHYPSCSEFARQCIDRYGWFKGIMLAADRLMRCNRLAITEADQAVHREDGLRNDPPDDYRK